MTNMLLLIQMAGLNVMATHHGQHIIAQMFAQAAGYIMVMPLVKNAGQLAEVAAMMQARQTMAAAVMIWGRTRELKPAEQTPRQGITTGLSAVVIPLQIAIIMVLA
jgi:hypothetical protein